MFHMEIEEILSSFVVELRFFRNRLESLGTIFGQGKTPAPCDPHTLEELEKLYPCM